MAQDTFSKGLDTLLTELRRSLTDRGVLSASARHDFEGTAPRPVTYTVELDSMTVTEVFSREEIEDSAIAIDAPAALKVRMLVSHFVR
jgi:hypothetical protein